MKKIVKKVKKYLKNDSIKASFKFTKYYEKGIIKEDEILIQSYDGSSISGNPYYLLLELCKNEKYKTLKKFVASNKKSEETIKKVIEQEKLENVTVVLVHSKEYCRVLAQAKYLINNSTFPVYFIKNEKQVYLNTWHGTPLKAMGREIIDSPHELGNTQRNFMMADYLLYQNDFMFEKMKNAYMLDNLYNGKYVISGYPRNDAFFDEDKRNSIRKSLNLTDKKVIVYMPTWRGTATKKQNKEQQETIISMINKLEEELDENSVVYLKIHNLASAQINYEDYTKIKPFPNGYETYQFLNIADCLITDYSSVMFDFANTGRKVILYIYDFKEYTENRGFYLNVKEMPFTKVYTQEELCEELKDLSKYTLYQEFKKEYCSYDSKDTSKKICSLLVNEEKIELKIIENKEYKNQKENILIFTGALLKNGITSSLKGLINNIDLTQYNYFLTFYRKTVRRNINVINQFPKECNYIPIQGQKNYTIKEFIHTLMYFKLGIDNKIIRKSLEKVYQREIKRIYPNMKFIIAIDFCGYDKQPINFIAYMDAMKIRYNHSNMKAEQKTRNNFHVPSLQFAYKTYDKIAVVREGLEEDVKTHFKNIIPKQIKVVHNLNDIQGILQNANEPIEIPEKTYCNIEKEELESILNDENKVKFINIGRFSIEKGQVRLIEAFKQVQQENKQAYLIIIGGHGREFNKIMQMIEDEKLENIIIIKNMDNPYPILKKCNLFVLSSYYEGLPMTIMESLILNIPILSVDIEGPRAFLSQGYAYLVEESKQGLLEGMQKYMKKDMPECKKFDAKEFNKKAIEEFYNLLKKDAK